MSPKVKNNRRAPVRTAECTKCLRDETHSTNHPQNATKNVTTAKIQTIKIRSSRSVCVRHEALRGRGERAEREGRHNSECTRTNLLAPRARRGTLTPSVLIKVKIASIAVTSHFLQSERKRMASNGKAWAAAGQNAKGIGLKKTDTHTHNAATSVSVC